MVSFVLIFILFFCSSITAWASQSDAIQTDVENTNFFNSDSLMSVYPPPTSLVHSSEIQTLFSAVNTKLEAQSKYLTKVEKSLDMGHNLLSLEDYSMALFEYDRATFYLENKIEKVEDSIKYEIELRKAKAYILKQEFRHSQQILERIIEDYLSYSYIDDSGENIVPGLEASVLLVENFVFSQRYILAIAEIKNIYMDFDVNPETGKTLKKLRDMSISLSSDNISDTTEIENREIEALFISNIKQDKYKDSRKAYRLSVIPGAGHFYAGDTKGGIGALVTNTFILAFLANSIYRTAHHTEQYFNSGKQDNDFNRIIIHSVDFFVVYQILFKRYYRGSANTIALEVEAKNKRLFKSYRKAILNNYDL